MIALSSPVAGGTVTGWGGVTWLTSQMSSPEPFCKSYQVTGSAGGTVPGGVFYHSAAFPFEVNFWGPKNVLVPSPLNPTTGIPIRSAGKNKFRQISVKAVTAIAGQPAVPMPIRIEFDIPVGAEVVDLDNIKAHMSFATGAALQQLNQWVASMQSGRI